MGNDIARVEWLNRSLVLPYEFNNRRHNETQIDRIAKSISEFGFNQPIVVDENNIVLVGHGRLLAAEKLGLERVPVHKVENLTDNEKRAYRILDNKLQNDSEWDFDNVTLELDFLEDNGFDIEEWGLDDLRFGSEDEEVEDDDFVSSPPPETFIKRGDLIELGPHRLLCGDSTSKEDVERLMNGERAVACITDPPYCVEYENQEREPGRKTRKETGDTYTDPTDPDVFLKGLFENIPSDVVCMTFPVNKHFHALSDATREWEMLYECVWVKNHFAYVMGRRFQPKHEPILIFRRKNWKVSTFNVPNDQSTVFEHDKPSKNIDHPTMKPLPLYADFVRYHSDLGDLIYEPFGGSGTTLLASEVTGRRCNAMEIQPQYCEVIIERYKANCEKEGKEFVCKVNGERI